MRHYEIVLLIHPDQSEQVPAMLQRYQDMVTANGQVHRVEDWGRRRLAYMIDEVYKAHYVLLNIECDSQVFQELEKIFKLNDSILRNLVIRQKRAITEPSPMAIAEEDKAEETDEVATSPATSPPAATVAEASANAPDVTPAEVAVAEASADASDVTPPEVAVAEASADAPDVTSPEVVKDDVIKDPAEASDGKIS